MIKDTIDKSRLPGKKTGKLREPVNEDAFAFGRINYILLFIATGLLITGYALMSGGKAENPADFNPEIFNFRRITLAPLIVMAGYALGIFAIVKKAE